MKKSYLFWGMFWLMVIGWFWSGNRIFFSNIPRYFETRSEDGLKEVVFKDGQTMTGVIESETETQIKLNMDGAAAFFDKASIQSVKLAAKSGFWAGLIKNYKKYHKRFPVFGRVEGASVMEKWDEMVMEPTRIADDIRKKHPWVTSQAQLDRALASSTQMAKQSARFQGDMQRGMQQQMPEE